MKKLAQLGALLGIVALVVLLVVGSVGAETFSQEPEPEPGGPGEPEIEPEPGGPGEAEPEPAAAAPAEAEPTGAATRINFELSNDSAIQGLYVVQEVEGRLVASWYAQDGWRDSGWIDNLKITNEAVHVQVLYYPGPEIDPFVTPPEGEPTVMRILNPAPGTEIGWLARGMAHALEVEFPDGVTTAAATGEMVAPVESHQAAVSAGEQVHVVQAGDNLFRIGIKYGCSVEEIVALNAIANPNLINIGQEIRIPANCVG
jgi:nucleoid-associated protein YgaU